MTIDAYAAIPSHSRHLRPIWNALPEDVRGHWYTGAPGDEPIFGDNPTLIAAGSALDLTCSERPVCLIEHGAGQSYQDVLTSGYAGGRGRERVSLFICPNERVADLNRACYPTAEYAIVGCPALDWAYLWPSVIRVGGVIDPVKLRDAWRQRPVQNPGVTFHGEGIQAARDAYSQVKRPTIGLAFHWECNLCPETRSAFTYYQSRLSQLSETYKVLGSGHPRARNELQAEYDSLSIETCWDPDDLIRRCDLICVDNSSVLYESAACGVPILALDAPGYRDEPRHGLRFYDQIPGLRLRAHPGQAPKCGLVHPYSGRENLLSAVEAALVDDPMVRTQRELVSKSIYGDLDGGASGRAVDAILEWAQ